VRRRRRRQGATSSDSGRDLTRPAIDAAAFRLVYGQHMQVGLRRLPQVQPRAADAALALALFGLGQAEAWTPFNTSLGQGSSAVAAALGAMMTLPLAFRRLAPVAVALLVVAPTPLIAAFTPVRLLFFGGFLPLLVVTYTLASRARSSRSLAAVALPFAALLVVELEVADFRKSGEVVFDWLWFGVAAVVGLVVRARSLRAERSESRVTTLETERGIVLREERARIARELHDVIAHSVSVIVIQAGAAEPLVDEDPDQAREALRSIRTTASDALGEMRRLLGILRTTGDELVLSPQPSVAQLEPLLAQTRTTGLEVELRIDGKPRPLPPGLDLTAYRIVQEALTNTRKHGRASRANVALRYTPSALEVEIIDNGKTQTTAASNGGHGLVGMRERVALYDGTLTTGANEAGGYAVRAVLPT
jgi:signal transduction histidine kinase